jgi:hypothetical protein
MKFPLLLFLFLSASAIGQTANVTFLWDGGNQATPENPYRLYRQIGTNWQLVVSSITNGVVWTNYNIGTSVTVTVTASNMLGESIKGGTNGGNVLAVPPAPTSPQMLKTAPLTLTIPLPGSMELSPDLVDWRQRITVKPNPASTGSTVIVTYRVLPTEPLMFARPGNFVSASTPLPMPIPIR